MDLEPLVELIALSDRVVLVCEVTTEVSVSALRGRTTVLIHDFVDVVE